MTDAPWSAYMALDGLHLDGLIGSAGVLRFDWPEPGDVRLRLSADGLADSSISVSGRNQGSCLPERSIN